MLDLFVQNLHQLQLFDFVDNNFIDKTGSTQGIMFRIAPPIMANTMPEISIE